MEFPTPVLGHRHCHAPTGGLIRLYPAATSSVPGYPPAFSISASSFQTVLPSATCNPLKRTETLIPVAKICNVCGVVPYQLRCHGSHVCVSCRSFFRRFVRRERSKFGSSPPCSTTKRKLPFCSFRSLEAGDGVLPFPVCNLSRCRNACQLCRFVACIGAGMKTSGVCDLSSSAVSSGNCSFTSTGETTNSTVEMVAFSPGDGFIDDDVKEDGNHRDSKLKNGEPSWLNQDDFFNSRTVLLKKWPSNEEAEKNPKVKEARRRRGLSQAARQMFHIRKWNEVMGPFLKSRGTLSNQLIRNGDGKEFRRANSDMVVVPPVSNFKGPKKRTPVNVILDRRKQQRDVDQLAPTGKEMQNNVFLTHINFLKESLPPHQLLETLHREEVKQRTLQEDLQKVVSQNCLQREIDVNLIAAANGGPTVEEKYLSRGVEEPVPEPINGLTNELTDEGDALCAKTLNPDDVTKKEEKSASSPFACGNNVIVGGLDVAPAFDSLTGSCVALHQEEDYGLQGSLLMSENASFLFSIPDVFSEDVDQCLPALNNDEENSLESFMSAQLVHLNGFDV